MQESNTTTKYVLNLPDVVELNGKTLEEIKELARIGEMASKVLAEGETLGEEEFSKFFVVQFTEGALQADPVVESTETATENEVASSSEGEENISPETVEEAEQKQPSQYVPADDEAQA